MSRLFGFECEVAHGVRDVLNILHSNNLLPSPSLHSYHCECSDCYACPDRSNPLHAQEDCTVEGEIITKPLAYGSVEADRTIAGLAAALSEGRGQPGEGAGFHVHVSHEDMNPADKVLLYRMFLRYQNDLAELASGQWGRVRDYNSPLTSGQLVNGYTRPQPHYHGNGHWSTREALEAEGCTTPNHDSYRIQRLGTPNHYCPGHRQRATPPADHPNFWTSDPEAVVPFMAWPGKDTWLATRAQTFEFRLWNSTRTEWRMRLAVGVSVAMVEAAKAGVNVTENDERSLVEVLVPFMDSDTLAGVLRQAHYIEEVRAA